ncbi:hypothetical protein [Myxococcus guangdongensis]|nr:hypothetical protein [Myxococcus guangdongensis]
MSLLAPTGASPRLGELWLPRRRRERPSSIRDAIIRWLDQAL